MLQVCGKVQTPLGCPTNGEGEEGGLTWSRRCVDGQVVGVDRVIAVDLQRPGNSTEATFFDVPVETIMTTDLGVEYFSDKADDFRGKVSWLAGWGLRGKASGSSMRA